MALPALLLAAAAATFPIDAGTEGILVEDHRVPVVTVAIELPVGTWSPWAIAHHAADAFAYQLDDPERALRKRADDLAASLGVGVDDRSMMLRAVCLKRDLPAVMDLLRDVLANERYDRARLEQQRRAQQIAWRGNETDIQFRIRQAAARSMFASGDPRRRPFEKPDPIETDPAKLAAARDALIRIPGRAIGFAGDLTEGEAREAAKGLLPPPTAAPPDDLAPRFSPVAPVSGAEDVPMRRLTQVYLALVRDSLPWTDPERPAYLVANHVLGGHFYSRLYVALRHEAGDTYGAGTYEEGDVVPQSYAAGTFTRAENARAIETKLRETMALFHEGGITEEERADAVSYLRGHRAFARQSAAQILDRFMTERRLSLPSGALDAMIDRAAALPLEEVNRFIREFYDPARFKLYRALSSTERPRSP